jgi:hypothetical protein
LVGHRFFLDRPAGNVGLNTFGGTERAASAGLQSLIETAISNGSTGYSGWRDSAVVGEFFNFFYKIRLGHGTRMGTFIPIRQGIIIALCGCHMGIMIPI